MSKRSGGDQVTLDPNTQQFVEGQLRPAATEAAGVATGAPGAFFNPANAAQIAASQGLQGLSQNQLQQFFQQAGGAAQNLGFAGQQGLGGIEQFFNPFQDQVIAGVQSDFDRQRQLVDQGAQQQATQAGAFGGSREAILRAQGLEGVNRAESSALSGIRAGGFQNAAQQFLQQQQLSGALGLGGLGAFGQGLGIGGNLFGQQFGVGEGLRGIGNQVNQEPLFRQQQRLGFLNQGLGPANQNTNQRNSILGSTAGGALAGSSIGGVPGAIVGGGIGLLGGLFG